MNIRGCEKYDPPHKTVRNRERAINKAQGAFVKTEFGISFSFIRGPWASQANYQLVGGGASELFANFDENLGLFKNFMYERICRSRNRGLLPVGFGTPEHLKLTWEEIQDDKAIKGMSEDFATNRWKCWSDRFFFYEESFDVLLLVILYILLTRGHIKNLEQDLPNLLGIKMWIDATGPLADVADPVELDIKNLREASKAQASKREKGVGSMLIVAESLSNLVTRKLGIALATVPSFVEGRMMKDITLSKTLVGCKEYHVSQACHSQVKVVKDTFKLLEDWHFLSRLGFASQEHQVTASSMREDSMISKFVFDLIRNVNINEIKAASFYSERPPYMFNVVKTIRVNVIQKTLKK